MKVKNIFKLAYIYFLSFISRALRERINRKVYRCSVTRTTNFSLYFFFISRQPLTFPGRLQPSIISRLCLNRRVRYGYGCFPQTHRHRNLFRHFSSAFKTKHGLLLKSNFSHFLPFLFGQALDLLVSVSSIHYCTYTSDLSTL